jgi:hypothetical protein
MPSPASRLLKIERMPLCHAYLSGWESRLSPYPLYPRVDGDALLSSPWGRAWVKGYNDAEHGQRARVEHIRNAVYLSGRREVRDGR